MDIVSTRILIGPVVAVALFSVSNAFAQESLLEHVIGACENDIRNYCSQVTPGEGRLMYCMAAHEDKVSGQCEYAFYQAASLLEQLSVAISYFAQQCQTEIETLCSDVEVGEGRLLTCLAENDDEVGDSCKTAIADTVGAPEE